MGETDKSKKALIISPYWQITGGGERYLLQIAASLREKFRVVLLSDTDLGKTGQKVFGMNLDRLQISSYTAFRKMNQLSRAFFLKQYDICFYMTDGSLFFPFSGKNFLVIQSPAHMPPPSPANSLKLSSWKIICYSNFMAGIIGNRLKKHAFILSPAVDT